MPPAITEAEFNSALAAHGFRIMRPGDPGFTFWGYIDIGGGVLVNRWNGGRTLVDQLSYLIKQSTNEPPPATKKTRKKGAKKNET